MLNDVVRGKLVAMLSLWDANGDGVIQETDYAVAADRIAGLSALERGTPEYEEYHQQLVDGGWNLLRKFCPDGERVTVDQCLDGFEALYADPERYKQVVIEPSYSTFDLIDSDHNGLIGSDEYRAYLMALQVDETTAGNAFAHIDADGDGVVTRDEFVSLMDQYFTSEDPDAAGNWLFGKP